MSPAASHHDRPTRSEMRALAHELFATGIARVRDPGFRGYLRSVVANDAALDRVIRAFELFAPYLPADAVTLDWGCRHAFDSCLMRRWLGPGATLHGCDLDDDDFSAFHGYAGLHYSRLAHVWELPYPDATFDLVLSSGVLEHVANEYESVKEVWRILKPGGILAVTFLPNAWSLSETLAALLKPGAQHNRLYRRGPTREDFLKRGFLVEASGYHQVFPTLAKTVQVGGGIGALAGALARLNRPLERVWPVRLLASNLYFILRKVERI